MIYVYNCVYKTVCTIRKGYARSLFCKELVAQGSILDPLFLFLCVDDVASSIDPNGKLILYADDSA